MARLLKITFALPGSGHNPVGGFKVVYEYASHLARRGHLVTIIHPALLNADAPVTRTLRSSLNYLFRKRRASYKPTNWFVIDPSVRMLWVPSLREQYIPDGDIVVATAWQTAEYVAAYPSSKGKRFYLIQHLETWSGSSERVYSTWKLPLLKIVIARWLEEIALSLGEKCVYIPNGLDFERFSVSTPSTQRNPHRALMLYHTFDWKGSNDGWRALSLAREKILDLTAVFYGVTPKPQKLPEWVEYKRRPSQSILRGLYNEASVFVAPSWTEGWPLPPAEAMMCATALVATDIGGHREYAINEETALLSPPRDIEQLAANIVRVMNDQSLRLKLANRGHKYIQQFTWKRATDMLESVFLQENNAR